MDPEQTKIKTFMTTMGQPTPTCPHVPGLEVQNLRLSLITEELEELVEGFANEDIVEIADAITDLLYVVKGAAIDCGLDLEPLFEEVHRSNMTKIGSKFRSDGKIMKSASFEEPKLLEIIQSQIRANCEEVKDSDNLYAEE